MRVNPTRKTIINDTGLSKKKERFIKFVVSPGTVASMIDGPEMVAPTGEKALAMHEMRMKQVTESPDADGCIVMLQTPFFEAPFIRIYLRNGNIESWKSYSLPGYNTSIDPLKEHQIYGWRMVGNSLTGTNNTAPINASGNVTIASLPLSLDVHTVYTPSGDALSLPISFSRALDYLPLTVDKVASITNQLCSHRATEGSYCVLRHTDPTLPFTYRNSDSQKATFSVYTQGDDSLTPFATPGYNYLCYADGDNYGLYCANEAGNKTAVTAPSCMNLGITIYTGLQAEATVTFKSVVAWDFIPKMNSSKISQCLPIKPRDSYFLDMLNAAELSTRAYGTAADNSLGSFLKGLLNVATKALPMVKELSASLPLPPQAKMVIDKVAEIVPKVNNAVNNMNQKQQSSTTTNQAKSVSLRAPPRRAPRMQ